MDLKEAVGYLDSQIPNKLEGLPDEVFYFISRTTPLINVDLLIQDKEGRTLLMWRDDQYCGTGWHIPGGIIRFKEKMEERIRKVALKEVGCEVNFGKQPLAINEIIIPSYENRAHFISLLFQCWLPEGFEPQNQGLKPGDVGYAKWHTRCPKNLIESHQIYVPFIEKESR